MSQERYSVFWTHLVELAANSGIVNITMGGNKAHAGK